MKLHVIAIPIFNVVLISDQNENPINNGNTLLSDKLYGNIVYKMQTEMSNLIQVPASPAFAAIREF